MTPFTREQAFRMHLNYDAETGSLRWAIPSNRKVKEGDAAGYITPAGYCYVTVAGHKTTAARVAWFLGTGSWPERPVLAKNGDPADVRLSNLVMERSKTHMLDIMNKPRADRTLEEWREIFDLPNDDPEKYSEEAQRAKHTLEILS